MGRKLLIHGYRVIIEVPCEHHQRGNYTPEYAHREAGNIARAITRHLGPYHKDCEQTPVAIQDAEGVCEYCGDKWREDKNSPHNGGCCKTDMEAMPDTCPRCKGTGAIDAPYSGSDPSCPDCDGEGKIHLRATVEVS